MKWNGNPQKIHGWNTAKVIQLKDKNHVPSLKLTKFAPENGWERKTILSFWELAYFRRLWLLVSGSEKTKPP